MKNRGKQINESRYFKGTYFLYFDSTLIVSTGTPNSYIKEVAEKYKLQLFVNPNPSSLASDWNFAMGCAKTELVTLAHQDDVYEKDY